MVDRGGEERRKPVSIIPLTERDTERAILNVNEFAKV